jgi:hypothetical protein
MVPCHTRVWALAAVVSNARATMKRSDFMADPQALKRGTFSDLTARLKSMPFPFRFRSQYLLRF